MNWTGGVLQRHYSRSNRKADMARQRKYFAKTRTNLHGNKTISSSPFRPRYLQRKKVPERSIDGQRKLDEYESTAPVIRRLGGMRRKSQAISRWSNHNENLDSSAAGQHGKGEEVMSQISDDNREDPEDCDSTKCSFESKTSTKGSISELNNEDSIAEKKRRLLRQPDWAGLEPTRPLHMNYSSKRTKFKTVHGTRFRPPPPPIMDSTHLKRLITRPVAKELPNSPEQYMTGAHQWENGSIKIRIGNHAIQNTQRLTNTAWQHRLTDGVFPTSDSMLFDRESTTLQSPTDSRHVSRLCASQTLKIRDSGLLDVDPECRSQSYCGIDLGSTDFIALSPCSSRLHSSHENVNLEAFSSSQTYPKEANPSISPSKEPLHKSDHDDGLKWPLSSEPSTNPTHQWQSNESQNQGYPVLSKQSTRNTMTTFPRKQLLTALACTPGSEDGLENKLGNDSLFISAVSIDSSPPPPCCSATKNAEMPTQMDSTTMTKRGSARGVDDRPLSPGFAAQECKFATPSSNSLRNLVELAKTYEIQRKQKHDEDELWRKFVFGTEDGLHSEPQGSGTASFL